MPGAGADGQLVGRDRRDAAAFGRPSMPISSSEPGGSLPVEAGADERAVMVVGGEAELDGAPLGLFTLVRPEARPRGAACRALPAGG